MARNSRRGNSHATHPVYGGDGDHPLYLSETRSTTDGSYDLLSCLSDSEYRRVVSLGRHQHYAAGDIVFHQGDLHRGISFVETGCMRVFYMSPSGREITLSYLPAGQFCGVPSIYHEGTHFWSGEAVCDSTVLTLPPNNLRQLLYEMPALAVGLVDGLVSKGKCYSALLQLLATRSGSKLLAHLILTLAEQHGVAIGEHVSIERPFTHEELAKMIGATRQWVSLTLRRLEEQSLIAIRAHRIVVLDKRGLLEISE